MLHLLKPYQSTKLLCIRPLLLSPSPFSSSPLFSSPAAAAAAPEGPTDLNPADVADAFRDWFISGATVLDSLYAVLARTPEGPALDSAISSLGLRLSEPLVLRALAHSPHPTVLPQGSSGDLLLQLRLKLFDWAGHQRAHPYRHTLAAYHAIFRLIARSRHVPRIFSWLNRLASSPRFFPFFSSDSIEPCSAARFHDTLVVGYAIAGRPERALHLLARMRFQGLDLDPFSYHVLLNSLVDAGIFDFADNLAAHMADRGLDGPVTDCIRIKGLCKQDRIDEAMGVLAEMQRGSTRSEGKVLDTADNEATDVVAEIKRGPPMKIEGRAIATATVVHALCKAGRFEEAVELVEEFGAVEAYGVLTSDLLGAGKLDSALKFLNSKKELEGYQLEDVHYNKLLFQLLRKNRLEEVYDVLVEMMEEGIVPSRATTNAALCFFCKAGLVDVAMQLYQCRRELGISPNKWVYNHLISSLCRNGAVEEVCRVLEESMREGYFPGKQVFSILANMLRREGKYKNLQELLEGARENAVKPTTTVLARCISALCKQGEFVKAGSIRHIFGGDVVDLGRYKYVYTGLIRAFIMSEVMDPLPELIIMMQESGHSPSRSLYIAVVGSLCRKNKFDRVYDLLNKQIELLKKKTNSRESDLRIFYNYFMDGAAHAQKLDVAMEVCNLMERAGLKVTKDTKIILLRGCLKSKQISKAIDFFSDIRDCDGREPTTRMYNIFISGLCEAGKLEQALKFWQEMRNKGMIPSLQCYEELVHALCTARDYDTVVKVIVDFKGTGRPISAFICNVLLLHTLKGRQLLRAWVKAVAGCGLAEPGWLLGELIAEFSCAIKMKDDFQNLEEKLEKSFPVDSCTYNVLLRGLTMAGEMDYACNLFTRMRRKGYEPNLLTYDIIVHGFCKQGNRSKAELWINEMHRNGYFPTDYTWKRFYNIG